MQDIKKRLLNYALFLLARRNYCSFDLQTKLKSYLFKKNALKQEHFSFDAAILIEQIVEQCCQNGWLNDRDYAMNFIQAKSNRGYGKLKIVYELKQKGFSESDINSAIDECEVDWLDKALATLEKKFKLLQFSSPLEKQKMMQFLYNKGFSQSQINEAIRAVNEKMSLS